MRASALLALVSLVHASHIWRPERPRDASRRLTQLRGGADEPPPNELAQKFSSWWAKSSAAALSGGSSDDPDVKKAADLMKKRGLDNVNKAVALLRGAHKRNPDDLAIGVDLADAAKKGQNARKGASGGIAPVAPKARGPTKTLRTKSTPVCAVSFTGRNLLMAMGARAPSSKAA